MARLIIDQRTDWKLWVLCDREPITDWIDGHVTLLGDAAQAAVRDHVMQGMTPQDWYDRLAWLYDGTG